MTKSWDQWVAGCCLVAARVPVLAQKEGAFVIDGNDWMRASAVARRAFLVGAGIGRAAGNTATGRADFVARKCQMGFVRDRQICTSTSRPLPPSPAIRVCATSSG